jgi:uncharacterized protein (DUF433 family)
LRTKINEVEKRDESLVTKLEHAVCFGKVMITGRAIRVRDFKEILAEVKYEAIDVPL